MNRFFRFSQIDKLVIVLLFLAMVFNMLKIEYWKEPREILYWDVISYYGYLPATFIYKDLTLEFKDDYDGEHHFVIWANKAENGNYVFKTSMGLSYLYMPWFFLGHAIALHTDYDAGGYSVPYKITMQFGVLIYLLIGLIFLRKILRRYFNPLITALSMISVIVGTNLYYYIVFQGTVSHSYNFVLFSIFLWIVIKWHEDRNMKNTVFLGLITGLITLIRPTNIIVLLIFVLWDIYSFKEFKDRLQLFIVEYKKVLMMVLMFLIVWIPQMIYWKMIAGSFFYYSYGDEGFFFLEPKFWKSLFSYRSGWLVYSPIMALALIGFPFMLKQKTKVAFVPALVFTFFNMWIIFSWWCWWWGGSYGLRPLIDSYVFLAIPLGSLIYYVFNRKSIWIKIIFIAVLVVLNLYGVHMTRKYYNKSIHFDGMNRELFWYNFKEIKPKPEFWQLVERPNYDNAKKGLDESSSSSNVVGGINLQSRLSTNEKVSILPLNPINGKNVLSMKCDDIFYSSLLDVFIRNENGMWENDTLNAFSGKMQKTNLLIEFDANTLLTDLDYELSFWYYNPGNRLDAYFYVNQIDGDGNMDWTNYHKVEKWSESFGNWSLVKAYFKREEYTERIEISFFYQNKYDDIVYYDNIIVRPIKTDVLCQRSDGVMLLNNQVIELRD
ncbi:MAG: hypothetical protein U9N51_02440 [Bacteroidota bacterium]|nr:hypothetical protein [Bacteroidota bacterium]